MLAASACVTQATFTFTFDNYNTYKQVRFPVNRFAASACVTQATFTFNNYNTYKLARALQVRFPVAPRKSPSEVPSQCIPDKASTTTVTTLSWASKQPPPPWSSGGGDTGLLFDGDSAGVFFIGEYFTLVSEVYSSFGVVAALLSFL
jgi:hypothetical protein